MILCNRCRRQRRAFAIGLDAVNLAECVNISQELQGATLREPKRRDGTGSCEGSVQRTVTHSEADLENYAATRALKENLLRVSCGLSSQKGTECSRFMEAAMQTNRLKQNAAVRTMRGLVI